MYQNIILWVWLKGQCYQTMFKGDHKSLYDKMIKPPNLGYVTESREIGVNLIIGGSKLQQLLPPQVQLM